MKKTLLAIMLAGTAFASQAGTLVSQVLKRQLILL